MHHIYLTANVRLTQGHDVFGWNLDPKAQFSVKSHYLAHKDTLNLNKLIWNLKTPLKIMIFLWYLRRGVMLTKDNLARPNCHGSEKCCFCHKNETIKHLFFKCCFARAVWGCIQVALGLPQPRSISHMFGSLLWGIGKDLKFLVLLGAASTCWSLWLCRNDLFFLKDNIILPCRWYIRLSIDFAHGLSNRSMV